MRRLALALLLSILSHPALAQRAVQTSSAASAAPGEAPEGMDDALVYGGDFTSHLQNEVIKPTGRDTKATLFDDSDANFYANYGSGLSVYGNLHLERNRNDNQNAYYPDANTLLRSEGLTMRQLFVAVRPTGELSLYGGKIHPNFGSAFAQTPGNFYNFASDYEQSERIGFGAEYRLPTLPILENARISLETHYLDTSPLSASLISMPAQSEVTDSRADRARRFTRERLGPANTGSLDSWTLALRGGRPEHGLTYQLSFEQQATRDPAGDTETGGSLGLMYDPSGGDGIPLGHRLGVVPFFEYARFSNFANTAHQQQSYATGGLAFHYVRWELDVAGGVRRGRNVVQTDGSRADTFDRQTNVSLGYRLTPHLNAGVGVNHLNVAGRGGSWSGGPSLSYELSF